MNKLKIMLSRYRLISGVLALAVLLAALAVTPVEADVQCEYGCIWWEQGWGCLECQQCCTDPSLPYWYECGQVNSSFCGEPIPPR